MAGRLSVLVIAARPDSRPSTTSLRAIVDELDRRDGIEVSTFFLRSEYENDGWPRRKVVDDLRAWRLPRFFEGVGARRLAGWMKGLRLRAWLASARPDVVILDDGIGGRVHALVRRAHVTVVRTNATAPRDAALEPAFAGQVDLVLVAPGVAAPPATRSMTAPLVCEESDHVDGRAPLRRRLDIPDGVLVVTGRGRDGWLDGPDLFIRALWELEHRDVKAHGVWFGLGRDRHEVERLEAEAARCGLASRIHLLDHGGSESYGAGDVVLLPYRAEAQDPYVVLREIAAGSPVVSFAVWDFDDPDLHVVPHLDLAAAADAIATLLEGDRRVRATDAHARLGARPWVDRFLAEIENLRR